MSANPDRDLWDAITRRNLARINDIVRQHDDRVRIYPPVIESDAPARRWDEVQANDAGQPIRGPL